MNTYKHERTIAKFLIDDSIEAIRKSEQQAKKYQQEERRSNILVFFIAIAILAGLTFILLLTDFSNNLNLSSTSWISATFVAFLVLSIIANAYYAFKKEEESNMDEIAKNRIHLVLLIASIAILTSTLYAIII